MITLTLLIGIWSSTCIQTQVSQPMKNGFARDIYEFEGNGNFEFTRIWYKDVNCQLEDGLETQSGTYVIGKKINSPFNRATVYELDFNTQHGTDLGAFSVDSHELKISRGLPNSPFRNTMLGLFTFTKN